MRILLVILLFTLSATCFAQDDSVGRIQGLQDSLELLAKTRIPELNNEVELSMNGTSLQTFVRALGRESGVNIAVDPTIDQVVSSGFTEARTIDILLYLCKEYSLEIDAIGTILSIGAFQLPPAEVEEPLPYGVKITYDRRAQLINWDLKRDTLSYVLRQITDETGVNFIMEGDLNNQLVNGYARGMTLNDALISLAEGNKLNFEKTEKNSYRLKKASAKVKEPVVAATRPGRPKSGAGKSRTSKGDLGVELIEADGLSFAQIDATDVSVVQLLEEVSHQLGVDYVMYEQPEGNTSLYVSQVDYETFLSLLFREGEFTYDQQKEVYLLGKSVSPGFRETEEIQLQYRAIKDILSIVPTDLQERVEIVESPELNSLIVSGDPDGIRELRSFIEGIDRLVPMVMIEVIVVDVNKSRGMETGLRAGFAEGQSTTSGVLFPDTDLQLGSGVVNGIIRAVNGLGVVNLGVVAENFFTSLRFLETEQYLEIKSTPKLATLNGNPANLKIGQTQYYAQTRTDIIGSQNPQTFTSQEFQETSADLSIDILPFVSGDEQVTLDIQVNISNFSGAGADNAPPPRTNREFNSMVRVKNEEMIVLGGLEEVEETNSSSGVPLLSRIPILKWFVSGKSKQKAKRKLVIFIKPTVIY